MALKVVNKATGEVIEMDYNDFEDFGRKFDQVTQEMLALARLKAKMAKELKIMMGDEDELKLNNGWYFKKYKSEYKSYDPEVVLQTFESDELPRIIKVDKSAVDSLLKEHVEDGGRWDGISKSLRSTMRTDRVTESLRLIKEG